MSLSAAAAAVTGGGKALSSGLGSYTVVVEEERVIDAEEGEAERFRVIAYSGYQGEQEPRALVVEGERLEVVSIQDRWYDPLAWDRFP